MSKLIDGNPEGKKGSIVAVQRKLLKGMPASDMYTVTCLRWSCYRDPVLYRLQSSDVQAET